jgi:hypothetical protein
MGNFIYASRCTLIAGGIMVQCSGNQMSDMAGTTLTLAVAEPYTRWSIPVCLEQAMVLSGHEMVWCA